jgi:hypothetical protein
MMKTCPYCGVEVKEGARFCSSCGKPLEKQVETSMQLPSQSEVAKRKAMSKHVKTIYALVAVGLFALFIFIFINHIPGGAHPVIANQPSVAMATAYTGEPIQQTTIEATVENEQISFPLPILLSKKLVAFDYKTETQTIPLLAYISAEGKLVTAFRMCEPCNSKTYSIVGTVLDCGNCETEWKLDNLEGIQGSCQKYPPEPIPSRVDGNRVVIELKDVKNWKLRL